MKPCVDAGWPAMIKQSARAGINGGTDEPQGHVGIGGYAGQASRYSRQCGLSTLAREDRTSSISAR